MIWKYAKASQNTGKRRSYPIYNVKLLLIFYYYGPYLKSKISEIISGI